MQRNTKSNCRSQHHNHKLSITQKSQLMSICLRLKHKLYIQNNGYIYVLQVKLAVYKIYKKGPSKSDTPTTQATCLVVVLHIVCNGVILYITNTCIQISFHLYGCGDSHIRIGESVSSQPQ
jgi:hypothetical protein